MIADLFLGLGGFFMIFGVIGMLRFPDVYTRLHASSKCGTTGFLSILIGLMIRSGVSALTARMLAIAVFVLITGPVASHLIAKSARNAGVPYWARRKQRE